MKEDDIAPNFVLPTDTGDLFDLEKINKDVVLFFYPKDNTPGCTVEAQGFVKLYEDITKLGVIIVGLSKDSIKSHANFKQKCSMPFTLLSDENAEICTKYGVLKEKSMFGKKYMGIVRTTFFINKNKIITKIWSKIDVDKHPQEVLQYIRSNK